MFFSCWRAARHSTKTNAAPPTGTRSAWRTAHAAALSNVSAIIAGRNEGLKSFCTPERGYSEGRAGHAYAAGCPEPLAGSFLGGYRRGRELHDLHRQLSTLESEIARSKKALTDGIPNPRSRAAELDRLEALTREAQQVETRIQQFR